MYDVPDDRLRTRIATICEDYGMQRIQYSTFVGPMSRNRQEEAFMKITRRVGTQEANVLLLAVCDKDLALRKHLVIAKEKAAPEPSAEGASTPRAGRTGARRRSASLGEQEGA